MESEYGHGGGFWSDLDRTIFDAVHGTPFLISIPGTGRLHERRVWSSYQQATMG